MTSDKYQLMSAIANRVMELMPGQRQKIDWMMDIEVVHDSVGLQLENLLNADDENFTHDLVGIANHLNRETKQLEDCFSPRYSQCYA